MARGTVGKRGSSYYIRYYDLDGQQHWETIGPRKKDAEARLADRLREINRGEFQKLEDITFAELAEKWKAAHAGKVRARTMLGYETHLRKRLLPHFGRYKVRVICPEMIEQFVAELMASGLSGESAAHYLRTLKLILKSGVIWGYLPRNPGQYVKPPKTTRKEMHFLSQEELAALIDAALPEHKAIIATPCLTGMRQGELLALSWDDIDFRSNRIHVRRAVSGRVIGEPKSKYSRRVIAVPASLMDMIDTHRARQAVELLENPDNLVFANSNGHLMDHSTLLRYIYWPALKRAGLPRVRFHDLRHSFASMLIHRGENVKYIQRVLGHSSIQTTLDIYGHLLPEAGAEVAERLEEAFFSGGEQPAEPVLSKGA